MEKRNVLLRILGLFSADELKALGKQVDLKGMSKLAKGDLVKAIANQTTEEAMPRFLNGEGRVKVQETIKNASALLGGAAVATERLGSITVQGDDVTARFDGMRWTTQCTMKVSRVGAPGFEHDCTCKAAETGALCVHFWAAIMQLIAEENLSIAAIGPFAELVGEAVESGVQIAKSKKAKPSRTSKDAGSKPFNQLLQDWTIEGRYGRAMEELGRGAPAEQEQPAKSVTPAKPAKPSKAAKPEKPAAAPEPGDTAVAAPTRKVKKPPATPYRVEVNFLQQEPGPPAKVLATLTKLTELGKEALPFRVLIDEKGRVVAHDGCMDFDMRLRRKQLLCKHLLQVFMSIDEQVARRLLAALGDFSFTNIVPTQKDGPLTLPEAIQRLKPDVRVADNDALKGAIMDYLFANENSPDKLGIDAIKEKVGEGAAALLQVMASEGMIEEVSPGHYKPK